MTDASKIIKDLQDKLDAAEHNAKRNIREYKRLCDENDRLRELVRDLDALLNDFCDKEEPDGEHCPAWTDKGVQCRLRDIEDRMSDLGIEVDQCQG